MIDQGMVADLVVDPDPDPAFRKNPVPTAKKKTGYGFDPRKSNFDRIRIRNPLI